MAKTGYIGVGNVARKASGLYVGVNDVARKVTKAYVGDANGKARLWFDQSGITLDKLHVLYNYCVFVSVSVFMFRIAVNLLIASAKYLQLTTRQTPITAKSLNTLLYSSGTVQPT